MDNHAYPDGVFRFAEWWDSLSQEHLNAMLSYYQLAREAFQAGYVSAVRHHDEAMRVLANEVKPH